MRPPHKKKPVHKSHASPAITPARHAVMEALLRQAERFPDLDPAPLRDEGLPPRDAAFAHAVYDAAIRRWLTLAHILSLKLRQPFHEQKPGVQAVLLAGATQLLLMDKVPPHAAINEAVNWAKVRLSGSIAGMVNGVLRNVVRMVLTDRAQGDELAQPVRRAAWSGALAELPLSDGRALVFKQDVFPDDSFDHLGLATSCPPELFEHWAAQFEGEQGEPMLRAQMLHLLSEPPTILNVAFASPETLAALSAGTPPLTSAHESPHARVWHGPRQELGPFLAKHPEIWVQDAASAHVVSSIALAAPTLPPGPILDLCAGQGTKTRHLAHAFPGRQIIATDVDPLRLESLRCVNLPNVKVVAPEEIANAGAAAAMVLADVPCSNSGVLARRPEAKYRWSSEQTERLMGVQQEILTQAAALLAPGGLLAYSTCSIDDAENQAQAAWAVETLGLTLEREETLLPAGLPGESWSKYRDGSYAAWLRRGTDVADSDGTKAKKTGTLKARRAKTASKQRPGSRA